MNCFKIYTPHDRFYISNNLIVYSLLGLFLLPTAVELFILKEADDNLSGFCKVMFFGMVTMMLVFIVMSIAANFRYKPLRGTLNGEIIFENNRILINDKVFDIADLSKISFLIRDFKGMYIGSRGDLDGKRSQGVDNRIALYHHKEKRRYVYFFQLGHKNQLRNIQEQLIQYHLAGKLHFLPLIDILGITKYEDIQEFKKEIGVQSV